MNTACISFLVLAMVFSYAFADAPCDGTHHCLNGGQCEGFIHPNGTLTTQCRCPPAFTGRLCESYICPNNPCHNNASCEFDGKSFFCKCPHGYIGDFCEKRQPTACDGIDCGNGECSLMDGRPDVAVCKCHKGFGGADCRQIEHCPPNACSGHGECLNHRIGFFCKCDVGFEGEFCEDNIDECVTNACSEGSTCIDKNAGYECICPPGKVGKLCELDDPCITDSGICGPGTCFSTVRGEPVCRCPAGLSGEFCEVDIDECATGTPCGDNGECVNTHGSYFCTCDNGFYGEHCEREVIVQFASGSSLFDPDMLCAMAASVLIITIIMVIIIQLKKCMIKKRRPSNIEICHFYEETDLTKVTVLQ